MTEPSTQSGTEPLPTLAEVTKSLQTMQNNLGIFVQCDMRHDEQGKANASAKVQAAYRKLLQTYKILPSVSQGDLFTPIQALHETLVTIGIPVGRFRLDPPELTTPPSLEP